MPFPPTAVAEEGRAGARESLGALATPVSKLTPRKPTAKFGVSEVFGKAMTRDVPVIVMEVTPTRWATWVEKETQTQTKHLLVEDEALQQATLLCWPWTVVGEPAEGDFGCDALATNAVTS